MERAPSRFVASQAEALLAALGEVYPESAELHANAMEAGIARGYTPVQAMADLGLLPAVERAVWARLGMEAIEPSYDDVDLAMLARLPLDQAKAHRALPLIGARLVAADPLDPDVLALARAYLGPSWRLAAVSDVEALAEVLAWAIDQLAARELTEAAQAAAVTSVAVVAPAIDEEAASSSEVATLVDDILRRAIERRASDVHFEVRRDRVEVRYRVDGLLDGEGLPRELGAAIVSRLKVMARVDIAQSRRPADGRFSFAAGTTTVDCRLVTLPSIWGESATVRLLDTTASALALGALGFSEATVASLRHLVESSAGALMVTGPTGSGKTTTLYALLAESARPERKILTIEDPVEYRIDGVAQHQVDPAVNFSFANALRSFLRADPDVIMVGEVRDAETAEMAVSAAYTGHLVLSSFHASSAALAPMRLVEMGIAPALVGAGVSAILAQRLVRRLCPTCRQPDEPPSGVDWPGDPPGRVWSANPKGCPHCATRGKGGYRGRVAIGELLVMDDRARRVVATGAEPDALRAVMREQRAASVWEDGLAKVAAGVTSLAELARVANADGQSITPPLRAGLPH